MLNRRAFLEMTGAGLLSQGVLHAAQDQSSQQNGSPGRLAVLTTEWRYHSHAWHMAERFLVGYPRGGRWHTPALSVVSAYVDQFPATGWLWMLFC